ncbi:cytochrome b [Marinobacterium nitratireducens]|uniref:Cytochrome b n=1 Tax=Marinobacterium nitratireducens TaxID=518897 RepID=A0A917ZNK9_9GAMM|nr:cytochrome b [Marinobacterium nitratireducens]GGO85869.1 cytochrome b [Marinobacterium nitratireducens]
MAITARLTNDTHSYGWVMILLHWLMALAIVGLYLLGLYIVDLTYYDPDYQTMPDLHRSIGILVLIALVLRLGWRALDRSPAPLPEHGSLVRLATKAGHAALYLLMLLTLVSGYLISTADGRPIEVFDWFQVPASPLQYDGQEDIAGFVHYWSATTLLALAGLHALAALKHHFIDKDATLKRIIGIRQETP